MPIEILFVLIIVVFVTGAILLVAAEKKRHEARLLALTTYAANKGFAFVPGTLNDVLPGGFFERLFGDASTTDEAKFLARFENWKPFGQGHSPEVENLMYGSYRDLDWAIFDYEYKVTTSNGKSTTTTTHHFTVVCARVNLILPPLQLDPETVFHRIANKLGMRELTFEVEEFNRAYFVSTTEERAAYDVLHPQMIEYLLARPRRNWQAAGCQIVLYEENRIEPDQIDQLIDDIVGFAQLLPGYLKEDRGIDAKWETPF